MTKLHELIAKWMKIFHEMSSNHFGDHTAEGIANTYRVCAEELEAALAECEPSAGNLRGKLPTAQQLGAEPFDEPVAKVEEFDARVLAMQWLQRKDLVPGWHAKPCPGCVELIDSLAQLITDAAGQAASGPTCHKCGKLVETGDVLCTEHEMEFIERLIAEREQKK